MRRLLVVLLVPLLFGCDAPKSPWPSPPQAALDLRMELSADAVPLLGQVEARFDLYAAAGVDVEFAPSLPSAEFAVQRIDGATEPLGDGLWRQVTLRLRPLRGPGELTIPVFTAKSKDGKFAAATTKRRLQVTSVLADAEGAIEAPAEPFDLRERAWWPIGLAAWLLAGGVALWCWRRRARPAQHLAVAVPPHVRAMRELVRLRASSRRTPAEVMAFYVAVSSVLREYVEERFGLRAPELTTEEFLREVERSAAEVRARRDDLAQFLFRCDLVKFAADVPDEPVHEATLAIAERFVAGTRADGAEASSA